MELNLNTTQKLLLSQRMVLSAKILQMSSVELNDYLKELAQNNPVVEYDEKEPSEDRLDTLRKKLEWLDSADEQNRYYYSQDKEDEGEKWNFAVMQEETLEEHLEDVLDELCNQLPEREYKRISAEIYAEDAARRTEEEAARTYAAYHVTERGQEWYFKTSPGEELLNAAEKLRGYATAEKGTVPDLFIKMFADGHPITAQEYNALTALRMENIGKVCGVFDVNFDKREFSAVHIMDGWQTWAMRDVSAAVYHATRSQFASSDDKWRKLLDHLSGKEITSAGHLSARNFSFGDEIIESDGKLNFYVQTEFDVDAAFGTFVLTDKNDDWLNIYANYDIAEDRPCDMLELCLCKANGTEENWSYRLNAAEREVLLRKMEEYCQQQTGMSLHDYAQKFHEEPEQQQGPVMKL